MLLIFFVKIHFENKYNYVQNLNNFFLAVSLEFLSDKTMDNIMNYIPNYDEQNYTFCRSISKKAPKGSAPTM